MKNTDANRFFHGCTVTGDKCNYFFVILQYMMFTYREENINKYVTRKQLRNYNTYI
jgi:hypothetical protein